jgi:superfamily II DNA or RNA helicase
MSELPNTFPEHFQFRHEWRPYQRRVLDELDRHLDDRHFHVAAAPGAGKTVLGIEAMRRLRQPALVLAPTTAIRDQWLSRARELFLPAGVDSSWLSDDLTAPGLITVSTYQALHAVQRKQGLPHLLARLHTRGVRTLVLDEAHHLRQEWWRCLLALKQGLAHEEQAPWLVALTATPPYDVPQIEWNRYIELCGPLDAEVAVPELVKVGNLCAHQDYLYFSQPAESERLALQRFDQAVGTLRNELALDSDWLQLLASHPLANNPKEHLPLLGKHSDFAMSLALALNELAAERCRALLHCLGLAEISLPAMHPGWLELLLNGLLFEKELLPQPEPPLLSTLRHRLRQIGAIERRQVHLRAPPRLLRLLEASSSKCKSISDIVELESSQLRSQLRAVVLCDLIREQAFPLPGSPTSNVQQMAVVPVFEHLRRLRLPDVRLGILSGTVQVIPGDAMPTLRDVLSALGADAQGIQAEPLWHAPDHLRLSVASADNAVVLAAMTELFQRGEINVLIGTAALLGEGWDAPAINSLILASSVRTSMRSNQMRGRAIRVQPGNPDKTANIWHPVCLLRASDPGDPHALPIGADWQMLGQRFRSFAGIGMSQPIIENGIERLAIDATALQEANTQALNAAMCKAAADRHALQQRWRLALEDRSTTPKRLVLETRVPLARIALATRIGHALDWQSFGLLRWLRERRLAGRLRHLAKALLCALQDQQQIARGAHRIEIRIGAQHISARLHGASSHEESLYALCLREMFERPDAPRYLIQRRKARYPVPSCLGTRKEHAELLRKHSESFFTICTLIYTHRDPGRLALLQAREQWLAGRFDPGCDSRTMWE